MEILISIVAKIAEYTVEPVVRQLGYVWFIDRNLQNLKSQVEKLKDTRDSVKDKVLNAKRNAQDIKPVVRKWLSEVDDIIEKSDGAILVLNEGGPVRLCPNLVQRHKLSRKATKLADEVIGMKNEGNFDQVSYNVVVSLVESSLPKISDFFNFESRKKVMKEIIDALLDDDVNKVGVYGMGGVGKTMLVKEILRKIKEKKSFDEVVISAISQTPDLRSIQGQLADKLGLNFQQETIEGRALVLQKRLKMEKSVLIVLDDVWEYIDLEIIGIPSVVDHKGCKILFTSRDKYLLTNEMCVDKFFEIEVIQKDESWDLFKTMVGGIDEDLKPIANQIVTECARLPIAITTVAKALRNKRSPIWKDALDQLKNPVVVNIRGMEKEVYSSLKFSYNHLEGEEAKLVFLLCSMFPEDFNINVEDLQVYAMGLGFLHGVDTVVQGRRRITKLVDDLISSSLLLPSEYKDNYVKMHDLVRDVAILIASKNDQIRTLSYVNRLNEEWDEEKLSGNHIASYLDASDSHSLPKKLILPNLQLLMLRGSRELDANKLAETFFEEMKELKCLDIIYLDISLLSPSLYNSFANIRLLRLIHCELGSIDMIGELKQLEILSFYGSNIIELPTTVSQLTQLKVLDLSSCGYLKVVRPNILSKLTKLEELYLGTFYGWEREDESRQNASLSELRDLSHLYVLNLNIQDETIMPKQLFSREFDLEKFQITIGRREFIYFPTNGLSRMLCIKMELGCFLDDWIKTLLKKSESLCLVGSIGTKVFQLELNENDYSHLKHLKLFDNLDLQHLMHEQNKSLRKMLSNLEDLEMDNLENFESINHGYVRESLFNKLRSVTVKNCNKLESLFFNSILDDFLNLDEIEIKNCKKMEAITMMMNSEEATNQIEFPHLKILWLQGLPRLQNFCSKIEKVEQLSLDNSEKADTKTISCNDDSFFSEQVSVPNLERLTINGADNLKRIWHDNILIPNSFSKLKEVEIISCNSLEKVLIPSNIMSMITCLNSLSINDCNLLKGIFEEVEELNATEKCLVVFRNLRRLELSNLPNLEYIRSKDSRELRFFEDITNLSIHECPKLKRAYPVKIVKQLECLEIDLDEFLEVVENEKSSMQMFESKQFETSNKAKSTQMQDGPVLFSKLTNLKLFGCLDYKLTQHLRLPMEVVRILHNLKEFEVSRIFIEEIFPNVEEYQHATSMPLWSLILSELPKLRHLWKENSSLENLEYLFISRCSSLSLNILFPSSMSFTSLVELEVNECHRLTHLLVPSIATTLVQLRYLTLSGCKMMITVIAEGVEEGNDEIVFNNLTWLTLEQFSKLRNFYSGKCIIKFPRLTKVRVTNCPEMKTFSLGVVSTPRLSTGKIKSFENGRWFPALQNHSEKEIIVKDINVVFRKIWEDNYDTDVKYLFPEENFDEENQSDPSSSSSYIVEERE